MSTAMIGSQPASFAAISAASPTEPVPNTAKDFSASGFITLITAPAPVWRPQPRGPRNFERRITAHLDGIARRCQRMARERGLLKKRAINRRPLAPHCHGSVHPHPARFQLAAALAVGPSVLAAMLALAAPRERDHDMITHGEMLDRTAYCEDDTSPLVTIDGGKGHREIAVASVQIGVANSGRGDLDQHLI